MIDTLMDQWPAIALWGLVASAVMSTLLEGSRLLGWSRMSLPFLFGTFVTERRDRAIVIGYGLYLLGGWLFAIHYAASLFSVGTISWWAGLAIGTAHGLFLIAVFLPTLPAIHPRLATSYDGAHALTKLEPPGLSGLNYGRATPLTTVLAQALFGAVLGLGLG